MSYEEEVESVLGSALLVVGAWVVELSGGKANHPRVFVKVLRDRRGLLEVDKSSVDKVDKLECRCRVEP